MSKVILIVILLGLLLIICCVEAIVGSAQPKATVAPSVNGILRVDGARLLDEKGDPVQLRGVSTNSLSAYPQYVNDACFEQLRSWGVGVVRLALCPEGINGYCTGGDPSALRMLVKYGVELAAKNDMYVIIDWHVLGDPETYRAQAEAFFAEMSRSFYAYNNVIYEICSDPAGVPWGIIRSYADSVISAIRANDPDGVILVGTPDGSKDPESALEYPITGYKNIMYAFHFYAAADKGDMREKMTSAAGAGLPVFVSEYGLCDASGEGSMDLSSADAWLRAMNDNGISYVQWNFSDQGGADAMIKGSVTKTYDFEYEDLSDTGRWLYDELNGTSGGMSGCMGCME